MNFSDKELSALLCSIGAPDRNAMLAAEKRQAELAKPPGSLGRLEELSVRLAGITGQVHNTLDHKELLVFASDNGVVEEGVSSAPQSVTAAQTVNLTRAKTGASVIAKHFGCRVRVCDVGVNADIQEKAVINKKIAYGTANIAKTAAMSRSQAVEALLIGAALAEEAVHDGADVIGIGEMGIGNTTTSSAVLAVLTGAAITDVTGRGGGITDDSYRKKISVIETSIRINRPDPADVVDVLAKIGGFDLAAMCGAFLGAAKMRVPAVIDGFISVTAALCAVRLCPAVRDYLIPSHASYEIGYRIAMDALGLKPLFDLGMRLGEGSGCPIAMMMLDAACAVMNDMATFDEASINDDYLDPIRAEDSFTVKGE
ncbi:MAG: nicotinate-nucleotide--dimethylbenzimidazole phosphoribosyltransferase [Clostridia bacterium]|nr:nicotinate-nucleotide--dimethylbenzimidazole phosphoribosyltransferase [Clostridia bacterium]